MKKKSILMFLLLICYGTSFSQKLIQDPYSGMEMELSIDNQCLKIIKVVPGSPADLSPFKLGDVISRIDDQKISEINNIANYFNNDKKEIKISLKNGIDYNIPRVTVNLFSDNFLTECELFNKIDINQIKQIFSDNTFANPKEEYELFDEKFQSIKNPQAYSVETSADGNGGKVKKIRYYPKLNHDNRNQITTLADNSIDILDSISFDFDYSSQVDPLMEKTLLNKLENHLVKLGLKRNTENPDILILINFYSGQKDNYVPPQQITSTKIKTYFNWYWGYIPVPVTDSKTISGYTETNYLINISLKFLDANKIENSKLPPVVWSGAYSEVGSKKVFISDAADDIYKILLYQFPLTTFENAENVVIDNFTYTGLIFNKDNMNQIADVIPGSSADKAGIRKGDIIYLHGKKDWKWDNTKSFALLDNSEVVYINSVLAYIFYGSNLQNGDSKFFKPLYWNNTKYRQSNSDPISFKGNRNGKKMKFEVIPEYVQGIFSRDQAFVF